jgi:ribosomal protein L37E
MIPGHAFIPKGSPGDPNENDCQRCGGLRAWHEMPGGISESNLQRLREFAPGSVGVTGVMCATCGFFCPGMSEDAWKKFAEHQQEHVSGG